MLAEFRLFIGKFNKIAGFYTVFWEIMQQMFGNSYSESNTDREAEFFKFTCMFSLSVVARDNPT